MFVSRFVSLTVCAALLSASLASGQAINMDAMKWGPGPAFLPPGAQLMVLNGDPGKAVPITLRLKFPAGYQIPAHWHPTQEDATVLSGSLNVGMGDVLKKSGSTLLKAGGFMPFGAKMNHYVWTDEETVVEVHLNGPFEITYVDPALDPRK
ncbi:cupin domain-containing protein [Deinococcus sp. SM5_A1]|uniref:cupin domain-containing protein n=1 Tax=Deinococcus sp. SM5_A1 TaxID=3379094 RepID=UPI003859E2E9